MHVSQRLYEMVDLKLRLSRGSVPSQVIVRDSTSIRFMNGQYDLNFLVTTAVFSTCGMNIFVFSIAAILSMPKQLITVYLGVILKQSNTGEFICDFGTLPHVPSCADCLALTGVKDKKSTIISNIVLVVTFAITGLAMWYILHQMNKVKPEIIYERRKAR